MGRESKYRVLGGGSNSNESSSNQKQQQKLSSSSSSSSTTNTNANTARRSTKKSSSSAAAASFLESTSSNSASVPLGCMSGVFNLFDFQFSSFNHQMCFKPNNSNSTVSRHEHEDKPQKPIQGKNSTQI